MRPNHYCETGYGVSVISGTYIHHLILSLIYISERILIGNIVMFKVKHFLFINCGGTINLVDILDPEEDTFFYVADR